MATVIKSNPQFNIHMTSTIRSKSPKPRFSGRRFLGGPGPLVVVAVVLTLLASGRPLTDWAHSIGDWNKHTKSGPVQEAQAPAQINEGSPDQPGSTPEMVPPGTPTETPGLPDSPIPAPEGPPPSSSALNQSAPVTDMPALISAKQPLARHADTTCDQTVRLPPGVQDHPPRGVSVVRIFKEADGFSGPTSTDCSFVGHLYPRTNPQYVFCKRDGAVMGDGRNVNHWWLWTQLDSPARQYGWFSAYYLQGEGDNEAYDINSHKDIPMCAR